MGIEELVDRCVSFCIGGERGTACDCRSAGVAQTHDLYVRVAIEERDMRRSRELSASDDANPELAQLVARSSNKTDAICWYSFLVRGRRSNPMHRIRQNGHLPIEGARSCKRLNYWSLTKLPRRDLNPRPGD